MSHNNMILKAPRHWDAEEHGNCEDLHITKHEGVMYSYHKPSWKEKILILFGRPIRLCICANYHPPVALDCEN